MQSPKDTPLQKHHCMPNPPLKNRKSKVEDHTKISAPESLSFAWTKCPRLTSSDSVIFRVWISKINLRAGASGAGNSIFRSMRPGKKLDPILGKLIECVWLRRERKRRYELTRKKIPGRIRAGSRESIRFVAINTLTSPLGSNPSNWLSNSNIVRCTKQNET